MIEPWRIRCPWCELELVVDWRAAHGAAIAAGLEAMRELLRHVRDEHGRSGRELTRALGGADVPAVSLRDWLNAVDPKEPDA